MSNLSDVLAVVFRNARVDCNEHLLASIVAVISDQEDDCLVVLRELVDDLLDSDRKGNARAMLLKEILEASRQAGMAVKGDEAFLPSEPEQDNSAEVELALEASSCSRGPVDPAVAFMSDTFDENARVRHSGLRDLCPCRVKQEVDAFWDRIISMADDSDPQVRYQVVHNLCDGCRAHREADVIGVLEVMHNDEDKKVKRAVHRVLSHYRRTGKWNIM